MTTHMAQILCPYSREDGCTSKICKSGLTFKLQNDPEAVPFREQQISETMAFKLAQHIESAHAKEWAEALEIAYRSCDDVEVWTEETWPAEEIRTRSRSPPLQPVVARTMAGSAGSTGSAGSAVSGSAGVNNYFNYRAMDTQTLMNMVAEAQRELVRRRNPSMSSSRDGNRPR
jgi:hypothetical protein